VIRQLDIPADQVKAADVRVLAGMLGNANEKGEAFRELQGTIALTFGELETNDEPILLNPQVRAYLRQLHTAIPHLFYFLQPTPGMGAVLAFAVAFSDDEKIGVIDGQIYVESDAAVAEMVIDRLVKAGSFAQQKGDDWPSIIRAFADSMDPEMQQEILARLSEAAT
jgi:hypothetical protein